MVYTFEPNPLNFYCLVQNCQADNVVKIQAALGAYCGTVRNIPNDRNTGMNMIDEYDETGHVPMLTLDSFSLKFLDLLYLDLEGHETKALKGAVSTILKHRPVVVLENADNEANDFLMNRCYEFVCQHHMDYFYVPK
jgi:FkbM family methyltransferase